MALSNPGAGLRQPQPSSGPWGTVENASQFPHQHRLEGPLIWYASPRGHLDQTGRGQYQTDWWLLLRCNPPDKGGQWRRYCRTGESTHPLRLNIGVGVFVDNPVAIEDNELGHFFNAHMEQYTSHQVCDLFRRSQQ